MNSRPLSVRRRARGAVAAAAAAVACLAVPQQAWALGLGRLVVHSALGEALRADIEVTSLTPDEASNLRVRVAPPAAYRAAGVDYNPVLPSTRASLQRRPDGRVFLRLSSDRPVQEPFVDVILEANWNTGRLVREYTLLLDPPAQRPSTATAGLPPSPEPAPSPLPAFSPTQPEGMLPPPPSPQRAPRAAAAPRPPTIQATAPPAPRPPRPPREAAPPQPAAVAGRGDPGAGGYEVRRGDTLTRIAARTQPPGVSIDEMLAALHRANPQAFIAGDIDRLRAGAVLVVPGADEALALAGREARPGTRPQAAADPGTQRERIAAAAPLLPAEGPSRQSAGRVPPPGGERQAAAPGAGADRLTLSRPGTPLSPLEELALREQEAREAVARAAELRRTVEEMQRLAAAASAPRALPGPVVPPAAQPATPGAPASATPGAPGAAGGDAAPAAAAAPTGAAVPGSTAAAVGGAGGSQAAAPVPPASAAVGPVPGQVPAVLPARPPGPAEPPPAVDRSYVEDYLPTVGLVAALLAAAAGLAVYAARRRSRRDGGVRSESSFLESRMQAESFFGAGGSQRVDAHDAAAAAATNYTPSQIDAIGDVDPVAEADVYLAYGRDLQAEEILKEALRASPGRLAIRSKLLEVYAKRRDTKGFELLATQLYGLTRGQGDEWSDAQALGMQIDPGNPLYEPGGRPPALPAGNASADSSSLVDPSTQPHSVLTQPLATTVGATRPFEPTTRPFEPTTRPFEPAPRRPFEPAEPRSFDAARAGAPGGPDLPLDLASGPDLDLDLDLDLSVPAPPTAPPPPEITRPMAGVPAPAPAPPGDAGDFNLPFDRLPRDAGLPDAAAAPWQGGGSAGAGARPPLDFDISDLGGLPFGVEPPAGFDLPVNSGAPLITDPGALGFDARLGGGRAASPRDPAQARADAYERKIELADEFRQIGDAEGARELLLEVVARATGAQKARAQSMLDSLS